ncbi:MAG: hypothetical protein QXQ69_02110 [Candidatus Aenigmatarchaeota archaeon]
MTEVKNYVGILFGLDKDRDARNYCLKLMKKYENNENFIFVDLECFAKKESKIKVLSKFSKVCFGVHSCDDYSPTIFELEFCDKGIVRDLAFYLQEKKLVDRLFPYPYEMWKLRDFPTNFGIIEIFGNEKAFHRFEQLLLQTLEFLKTQRI